jgi:transposase
MNVLYLKSQGVTHKEIMRIEHICENTLLAYLRQYQDGGVERLKEIHFYSPKSELAQYTQTIEDYFHKNPPATINEAVAKIEELTGIRRSREQVRIFLKGLGLSPRKVGMIPAKADVQVQEKFLQEQLQPRIEEARAGKRVIFFVDAVHFVLAPFLGILWTLTRLFVRAPAGRQRFNVLGALNALTHKLIRVNNDSYASTCSAQALMLKVCVSYSLK